MNADKLIGINNPKELSADKYNEQINKWVAWWNDHNAGVRIWDKVNATNATITNLTATNATITALTFSGDLTLTGNLIFNPTTKGVKGTTTNDNAAAGNVGESVYSAASSQNFPANNVIGDGTSISLTAGDWDVTALMFAQVVALTTNVLLGISITSGNSGTGLTPGDNRLDVQTAGSTGTDSISIPNWRLSIASTTTVYLKVQSTYTGTTPTYYSRLSARRMR